MYGFVQYNANRFVAYPTLKECLKHARTESIRQYKAEPRGIGDTGIFKFPKDMIREMYYPKEHMFSDYAMDHIIGMVWTSNIYPPQYQAESYKDKYSRDINPDGSLGKIGWRRL